MILDIIKKGAMDLDISNYNLFIDDYSRLNRCRNTASFIEVVRKIKKSSALKPFMKRCFDRLSNKYNYHRYRQIVLDEEETRLCIYIFTQGKSQEERDEIHGHIISYLITETYVGFMVEYILAEALKSKRKRVYQNDVLDIDYKTDLLVCGRHYQIKNFSFLETSWIEHKLKYYGEANRRLYFLFYTTTEQDISFMRIGGKCSHRWNLIDDFTKHQPCEKVGLDEFITSILAE